MNEHERKLLDDYIKFVTHLAMETGTSPAEAMQLEMILNTAALAFALSRGMASLAATFPQKETPDESGDQPGT